jgi:L-ascorbate metabolism protein UlaG (beta-lactamase superfamily)
VGGVFTLNEDGAASLVEQVKPRLVIPMHFKTGKCGFPLSQVDEFAKRMTNVKKTGQSEVEVSAADLPASGPEVWILEHAK